MKVSDTQIQEFIDMFGDSLPNYEHEPRKFLYYWQLYLQVLRRREYDRSK